MKTTNMRKFLALALVMLLTVVGVFAVPTEAKAETSVALDTITSGIQIEVKTDVNNLDRSGSLKLALSFNIDNAQIDTAKGNDQWVFDITDHFSGDMSAINWIEAGGLLMDDKQSGGTYELVKQDGKVLMVLRPDPKWLNGKEKDISGMVDMNLQFDAEKIGSKENYKFEFPSYMDPVEVKFKEITNESGKSIDNCYNGVLEVTEAGEGAEAYYTINYKVNVKSGAAGQTLVLEDTVEGPQSFNHDVKVFYNNNSQILSAESSVQYGENEDSFTLDLSKLLNDNDLKVGYNESYTVTYSTKVLKSDFESKRDEVFKNSAKWTINGTDRTPDQTTTILKNKLTNVKKSVAESNGDYIWTITVTNPTQGYIVTDTMSSNQQLDGDIVLTSPSKETTTINPDPGDSVFAYTFSEVEEGDYTITYTTKPVDGLFGQQNFNNKVTVEDPNGGQGSANAGINGDFGYPHSATIQKEGAVTNAETGEITWTIRVELEEGVTEIHNAVLTDSEATWGYGSEWGSFFTVDLSNAEVTYDHENDSNKYHYDAENAALVFDDLYGNATVTVKTVVPGGIDPQGGLAFMAQNKAKIVFDTGESKQDEEHIIKAGMMNKNGAYVRPDQGTPYFSWTIEANAGKTVFSPDQDYQLNISDALPEGHELVYLKITDNDGLNVEYQETQIQPGQNKRSWTSGEKDVWVILDYYVAGHSYKLTSSETVSGKNYTVTYQTRLKNTTGYTASSSYTNIATLTDGNGTGIYATATVDMINELIQKTSAENKSGSNTIGLTYMVHVNPDGARINGGYPISVRDELATDMVELDLIKGVQVVKPKTTTPVAGATASYSDGVIVAVIPDSTPADIVFTVNALKEGYQTFDNTATLFIGDRTVEDSDSTQKQIQFSEGAIVGGTADFTLKKIDNKSLASIKGATFVLTRYEGSSVENGTTVDASKVKDATVVWEKLDMGVLYSWEETVAPEGYDIAAPGKHFFILYNNEENEESAGMLKTVVEAEQEDISVSLIKSGITINVGDTKQNNATAELKIQKVAETGYNITDYSGITWSLKKVKAADLVTDEEGTEVPYASDATGLLTVSGLQQGIYELRETNAPDGFAVGGPWLITVFSQPDGTLVTTVTDTATGVANSVAADESYNAINYAKGSLSIKKKWQDSTGAVVTQGLPESVDVDVYRLESETVQLKGQLTIIVWPKGSRQYSLGTLVFDQYEPNSRIQFKFQTTSSAEFTLGDNDLVSFTREIYKEPENPWDSTVYQWTANILIPEGAATIEPEWSENGSPWGTIAPKEELIQKGNYTFLPEPEPEYLYTTVTLEKDKGFTMTLDGLPIRTPSGEPYYYRIMEKEVPAGWKLISGDSESVTIGDPDSAKLELVNEKEIVEYVSVSVTKEWKDASDNVVSEWPKDASGQNQPVTFTLMADGVAVEREDNPKTVSSFDTAVTWENLPVKNDNGQEIVYTVQENSVSGYRTTVSDINDNGNIVVTNTEIATTSHSVEKVWENTQGDEIDWPIGVESIEVHLYANNNDMVAQGVTESPYKVTLTVPTEEKPDADTHTWEDLPTTDATGNSITYKAVEIIPAGVTSYEKKTETTANGTTTITNKYKLADFYAVKQWLDGTIQPAEGEENPNYYIEWPDNVTSVSLQLHRVVTIDGEQIDEPYGDPVAINKAGNTAVWPGLPLADDNENPYSYYVEEISADGTGASQYMPTTDPDPIEAIYGELVTGVFNIKKTTDIKVEKQWQDLDGNAVSWPDGATVTVQLHKVTVDGEDKTDEDYDDPVTLSNTDDNRTYTWTNVPYGDNIKYYVVETANTASHYVAITTEAGASEATAIDSEGETRNNDAVYTGTITLKNKPETVSVSAKKEWKNVAGGDLPWPTDELGENKTVKLTLLEADGKKVQRDDNPKTVSTADVVTWNNLPKYTSDGSTEINYSVEETSEPSGYVTAVTTDKAGVFVVTNTKLVEVVIPLSKVTENAPADDETEFKFTLEKKDPAGDTPMPDEVSVQFRGNAQMGPITYTQPGTYEYLLKEEISGNWSIKSGTSSIRNIKVVVTDGKEVGGNGQPTAKVYEGTEELSPTNRVVFTNVYVTPISLQLEGTKKLEGRDWENGDTFSFTINEVTKDAEGKDVKKPVGTGSTAYDSQEGRDDTIRKIAFTALTFEQKDVGLHHYVVTEDDSNIQGIKKDNDELDIYVKVSIENGVLSADYVNNDGSAKTGSTRTTVDFVNTYGLNGFLDLTGTKTLTGRDWDSTKDKYEFEVKQVLPVVAADKSIVATGTNLDENGNGCETIKFTRINYGASDIDKNYKYEVTEKDHSVVGVTKDSTVYTVTVDVGQTDSKLTVTSTITNAAGQTSTLAFKNTYETTSISAVKVWKNEFGTTIGWPTDATVTFTLYNAKTSAQVGVPKNLTSANVPASWSGLDKVDADGNEIEYYVVETKVDGYDTTYSTTVIQETATAADVKVKSGTITVTNKAQKEKTSISAQKVWKDEFGDTLTGWPTGKTVTLDLYKVGSTTPVGEQKTLTSADDDASWSDLDKFDAAGNEIEYYVVETEMDGYDTTYVVTDKTETSTAESVAVNAGTITVTNKAQKEKTSITVKKAWKNAIGEPLDWPIDSVDVKLLADGLDAGKPTITLTKNKDNDSWTNLIKYKDELDPDGNPVEIVYSVQEITPCSGFVCTVGAKDQNNEITVTNTSTELEISKFWKRGDVFDNIALGETRRVVYKMDPWVDIADWMILKNDYVDVVVDNTAKTFTVTYGYTNDKQSTAYMHSPYWFAIEALPVGDYTITEADCEIVWSKGEDQEASLNLENDYCDVVYFTNQYKLVEVKAPKSWGDAEWPKGSNGTGDIIVKMQLYADGKPMSPEAEWPKQNLTSEKPTAVWENLPKYRLDEDTGTYVAVEYTVKEDPVDGYITVYETPVETTGLKTCTVTNKRLEMSVLKTDAAGGPVPDATLSLYHFDPVDYEDEEPIDSWVTGQTAHKVDATLVVGEIYVLFEETAPKGYLYFETVGFRVEEDGSLTFGAWDFDEGRFVADDPVRTDITFSKTSTEPTVNLALSVKDEDYHLYIRKTDLEVKDIENAELAIYDASGKSVVSWNTKDENPKDIASSLELGKTYVLRETKAPDGFLKVPGIVFTLSDEGKFITETTASNSGIHMEKEGPGAFTYDADKDTLTVKDAKTEIKVSKVDVADGKELKGAHIQILTKDEDGKEKLVEEWDSTKDVHSVKGLKNGVEYILRETVAPDGYTVTTDTTFIIDETGKVTSTGTISDEGILLVEDTLTAINVKKIDAENPDELLEKAKLQILDSKKEVVAEWTSGDSYHAVSGLKVDEVYTLHEVEAPAGYTLAEDTTFKIEKDGTITPITAKLSDDGVLVVEDAKTEINVKKIDAENPDELLEKAKLQILNSKKEVVAEWTSGDSYYTVSGLKVGEVYTLHEAEAPAGYTLAEDTTFKIEKDGTITPITAKLSDDGVLVVEDVQTEINVKKIDAEEPDELLEKAKLQILNSKNEVVDEWETDDSYHAITGLHVGEKYVLHEVKAPDKYTLAEDIPFEIDKNGHVIADESHLSDDGMLVMEDAKTSVNVSKVDIADGEELKGATIQILDDKGKVIEQWVSDYSTHEITGLLVGVEYTLRETVAPEGYTVTTDTTFTLDENGRVTTTGSISDDGILLVKDAMTVIKVSKVDIADGKELEGATIQILDKDGKVVDEWVSKTGTHEVIGLKTGVEYTLHEVVAPLGYTIATDTTFTIDEYGKVTTTGSISEDGILLVEDALELTSLSVTKVWEGPEAGEITLNLFANGEKMGLSEYDLTRDGYVYTFTGLRKYDAKGKRIEYTVTEKGISGYTRIYINVGEHAKETKKVYDGGKIINREQVKTTSIKVRKVWSGLGENDPRPAITLTLYKDGVATSKQPKGPDKDGWYTWSGLTIGSEYYVVEEPSDGYKTTYSNPGQSAEEADRAYNGGTITNTCVPKTGDSSSPLLWIGLAVLALLGIGGGVVMGKKSRK